MQDIDRVRFVAGNYLSLQGLRALPVSGWLIAVSLLQLGRVRPPAPVQMAMLLGLSVLAILLYARIGRYYMQTFGTVKARISQRTQVVAYVAMFGALILGILIDGVLHPPVLAEGLAMMLILLAYWWTQRRFRRNYALAGVLIGMVSLLPLVLPWAHDYPQLSPFLPIFNLIFGSVWLMLGLLDHRLLLRTLTMPREAGELHV